MVVLDKKLSWRDAKFKQVTVVADVALNYIVVKEELVDESVSGQGNDQVGRGHDFAVVDGNVGVLDVSVDAYESIRQGEASPFYRDIFKYERHVVVLDAKDSVLGLVGNGALRAIAENPRAVIERDNLVDSNVAGEFDDGGAGCCGNDVVERSKVGCLLDGRVDGDGRPRGQRDARARGSGRRRGRGGGSGRAAKPVDQEDEEGGQDREQRVSRCILQDGP